MPLLDDAFLWWSSKKREKQLELFGNREKICFVWKKWTWNKGERERELNGIYKFIAFSHLKDWLFLSPHD